MCIHYRITIILSNRYNHYLLRLFHIERHSYWMLFIWYSATLKTGLFWRRRSTFVSRWTPWTKWNTIASSVSSAWQRWKLLFARALARTRSLPTPTRISRSRRKKICRDSGRGWSSWSQSRYESHRWRLQGIRHTVVMHIYSGMACTYLFVSLFITCDHMSFLHSLMWCIPFMHHISEQPGTNPHDL